MNKQTVRLRLRTEANSRMEFCIGTKAIIQYKEIKGAFAELILTNVGHCDAGRPCSLCGGGRLRRATWDCGSRTRLALRYRPWEPYFSKDEL